MSKKISENKNLKDTVCAVVVTYNRKNLLLECLEALLKQTRPIDAMYIIDNFSSDGTPEALKGNRYIINLPPDDISEPWEKEFEVKNLTDGQPVKIHYVRLNENTGGAGGFYEGVKRGYEKGYDWLWLMDDDAEPALNSLKKIFIAKNNIVNKNNYIVLWNQIVFEKDKKDSVLNKIVLEPVDHAMFVGFFINTELVKKIGLPDKSFFIYFDDIEYCLRIRRFGGRIFKVLGSFIYHKDWMNQRKITKRIFNKNLSIPDIPKWKFYYLSRNYILMNSYNNNAKLKAILNRVKLLIIVLIVQPKYFTMIILGIIHGVLGISGKK
jgi:GT2 family glycosyltransferase